MAEYLTNSYEVPDSTPRNIKRKEEGGKEGKGQRGQEEKGGEDEGQNGGKKREFCNGRQSVRILGFIL